MTRPIAALLFTGILAVIVACAFNAGAGSITINVSSELGIDSEIDVAASVPGSGKK